MPMLSMLARLAVLLAVALSVQAEPKVQITELAAAGRQGLRDEDGDTPDWIELQNVSSASVELRGWTLTESSKRPHAWSLPATNLSSGQRLVIFASGKNRAVPGQPLHASFKLPSEAGTLVLRSADSEECRIDNYPPQIPGVSFGRAGGEPDKAGNAVVLGPGAPLRYLASLTPGASNASPVWDGPQIVSVKRASELVGPMNRGVVITAKVVPLSAPVSEVHLRYRVMTNDETEVRMLDDGQHGDGAAGDQMFAATIPFDAARPGQLIRYYVVARSQDGRSSRWPLFANRPNYSACEGALVPQPDVQTRLPRLQMFSNRRDQSGRRTAHTVGIWFEGEYYDNVVMTGHGQISRGFPKHSLNLRFPNDHPLRLSATQPRVKGISLLANFADKSKVRNTLAYEMISAAGSIGHWAFPVRMEINGRFYSVAEIVERGDERWLQRVGLDPQGALYKMNNNLSGAHDAEKKTRRYEGNRDLAVLAAALSEERPLEERAAYAYSHVNLPQCVSYFVAMTLISSDDHGHKNYYLYRDSRNTGEWALLPWDVDLSWGHNWTGEYFNETIFCDNPLNLYRQGRRKPSNRLYNLFFQYPEFRQMYLRRLRSVMDELLMPPGTPPGGLFIEKRLRELLDQIDPPGVPRSDADLDQAAWPSWGTPRSAREEGERILLEHLPGRRQFLFKSSRAKLYGDGIPPSQAKDLELEFGPIGAQFPAEQQFITITNRHAFAVDLSGWRLQGRGVEFRFRPGTVLPASKALYVVANVARFRSKPPAEAGAPPWFVQGNWSGQLTDSKEPLVLTGMDGHKAGRLESSQP